jgi:hypothetical protein
MLVSVCEPEGVEGIWETRSEIMERGKFWLFMTPPYLVYYA